LAVHKVLPSKEEEAFGFNLLFISTYKLVRESIESWVVHHWHLAELGLHIWALIFGKVGVPLVAVLELGPIEVICLTLDLAWLSHSA